MNARRLPFEAKLGADCHRRHFAATARDRAAVAAAMQSGPRQLITLLAHERVRIELRCIDFELHMVLPLIAAPLRADFTAMHSTGCNLRETISIKMRPPGVLDLVILLTSGGITTLLYSRILSGRLLGQDHFFGYVTISFNLDTWRRHLMIHAAESPLYFRFRIVALINREIGRASMDPCLCVPRRLQHGIQSVLR